jgi:hypothetical protein
MMLVKYAAGKYIFSGRTADYTGNKWNVLFIDCHLASVESNGFKDQGWENARCFY